MCYADGPSVQVEAINNVRINMVCWENMVMSKVSKCVVRSISVIAEFMAGWNFSALISNSSVAANHTNPFNPAATSPSSSNIVTLGFPFLPLKCLHVKALLTLRFYSFRM